MRWQANQACELIARDIEASEGTREEREGWKATLNQRNVCHPDGSEALCFVASQKGEEQVGDLQQIKVMTSSQPAPSLDKKVWSYLLALAQSLVGDREGRCKRVQVSTEAGRERQVEQF